MGTIYIVCGIILIACAILKVIFSIIMKDYWTMEDDGYKFLEVLLIISFLLMGISNLARGIESNKVNTIVEVVDESSSRY